MARVYIQRSERNQPPRHFNMKWFDILSAWTRSRVQIRNGQRVLVLDKEEARALLSTQEGLDLVDDLGDSIDVSAAAPSDEELTAAFLKLHPHQTR
jgi:hypothetical protein